MRLSSFFMMFVFLLHTHLFSMSPEMPEGFSDELLPFEQHQVKTGHPYLLRSQVPASKKRRLNTAEDNNYKQGLIYKSKGPTHYSTAYRFFMRAARKGHPLALFQLGAICEEGGQDLEVDLSFAISCYQIAANKGVSDAEAKLDPFRDDLHCSVCMDRKPNKTFQCKHKFCGICARRLKACAICRTEK